MADKTGYIGRNPNDSAVTVARQFFTASGVTTTFTFASGYLTGYLDVYVDGVKRRVADEFTATDGSTFDVLQGGVSAGSTVEAVAYKAFNAAAISGDITGNFDVSGNSTLGGSLSVTGGTTLSNINVTGIATLGAGTTVAFANTAFNLSGTPDISVDLLSAVDINVSGAATIGGVLTYEDVTNIDSVGIVTARTGVEVTANGLVVNAGVSTFAADVSIADKIVHTGDTNTAIRFPSADTITAETAGVERLRIDSNGDVGLVGIATATGLVVVAGSGVYAGHTGVVTAVTFDGNVSGGASGDFTIEDKIVHSGDTNTAIRFPAADTFTVETAGSEAIRVNSSGSFGINETSPQQKLHVGGDVEIGFASPTDAARQIIFDANRSSADATIANINWQWNSTNVAQIRGITGADTSNKDDAHLAFFTAPSGSLAERLRITSAGNVSIKNDSGKFTCGASDDLEIFHDGSNSFIKDVGTGILQINTNYFQVKNAADDEFIIQASQNGAVSLRFDNSEKFATKSDGVDITGELQCDSLDVDGAADITGNVTLHANLDLQDDDKILLGTGDDLEIYHNGTNSFIDNSTGIAVIRSNQFQLSTLNGTHVYINVPTNEQGVELYYDNSKKLETKSDGVDIIGELQCDTLDVDGNAAFTGGTATFGNSSSGFSGTPVFAYANTTASNQGTIQAKNFGSGGANFIGFDGSGNATVYINTDGSASFYGNVDLQDNDKLLLGTGDDLEIYHDGSASYIHDNGTGDLNLCMESGSKLVIQSGTSGNHLAEFNHNGAAELFHNGSQKLETTSSGITVTGTVTDSIGSLRRLGTNTQSSNYTLVAGDAGKAIIRNGGNVTVPNGIFSAGDMVTIINNASSDMTVTQGSSLTLYNSGDSSTGNVTQADRSASTIVFASSSVAYIAGGQLS